MTSLPPGIPESQVKHNYPLAVRDASLRTAVGLFMKTLPYAAVRLGILLAASLLAIVWAAITFGVGFFLVASVNEIIGYVWIGSWVLAMGMGWHFFLRYALYLLKAGHVAVLTELILHGEISNGDEGMFTYGKRVVTERFTQVSVLFGIDVMVDAVVKSFNRTLDWVGRLIPIPGLQSVIKLVKAIVHSASTYVDETIMSYIFARGDKNPWEGGRDGLIYYCQNAQEILKTAVWVVIIDKVVTAGLWFILLLPAGALIYATGGGLIGNLFLFASVLVAANLRSAVLEPLFLIMVMTKFHVSIENQPLDATWDARLTSVSHQFSQIKDRASEWAFGEGSAQGS